MSRNGSPWLENQHNPVRFSWFFEIQLMVTSISVKTPIFWQVLRNCDFVFFWFFLIFLWVWGCPTGCDLEKVMFLLSPLPLPLPLLALLLFLLAKIETIDAVCSQPFRHPQTNTIFQKGRKCHEMGRHGSKINIARGILQHFSRRVSWWRPFRSKPLFLDSFEKLWFLWFLLFFWFFYGFGGA